MTIFDLKQVSQFTEEINATLDRCDHGEGAECSTLEAFLTRYADCCCAFTAEVRKWARDVFSGRVAYNQQAEQAWLLELTKLRDRAKRLADYAGQAEAKCHSLDEEQRLCHAIYQMNGLLDDWASPRLSVGPAARRKLNAQVVESARRRIKALKALPKDWNPADDEQRTLYQKFRSVSKPKNA